MASGGDVSAPDMVFMRAAKATELCTLHWPMLRYRTFTSI